MKTFSVVVPVYQNELNLHDTIPKLLTLQNFLPKYKLELVFVDDGSTDKSLAMLKSFQAKHPNAIVVVKLSRNFGQSPAIQAGLRHASGDCVGIISADLQEPYELFVNMIAAWETGSKFVIGERTFREENLLHQKVSKQYWNIVRKFAFKDFPEMGYDFCLLDRSVVNQMNRINEKNTSIFPLIFWLGYQPTRIPITRSLRSKGVSQWSFVRKMKFTVDTLIAFTYVPTRMVTYSALFMSALSAIYLAAILVRWLFVGSIVAGWASIIGVILLFASLTLFSLGIVTEYLWRILDEARERPPFIVEDVIETKSVENRNWSVQIDSHAPNI